MIIKVKIKSVYGVDKVYPLCKTSQSLALLAGTLTLTDDAITIIKSLGYEFEIVEERKI